MIPENITQEHILNAIEKINEYGIPAIRESKGYDVLYNGSLYPPKYVISLANIDANGQELPSADFYGGPPVNNFLIRRGFEIVPKINEDLFDEIEKGKNEFSNLEKTEQDAIIKSRIGQGKFRNDLIELWGSCSVTGVCNSQLLRASHIKPWKDSSNEERLDRYNGLMLIPNLDLLFDCGFVSFCDNGKIMISRYLPEEDINAMGVDEDFALRKVHNENLKYLKYHRDNIFRK